MKIKSKLKYQEIATTWFQSLQHDIRKNIDALEKEFYPTNPAKMKSHKTSQREGWYQERFDHRGAPDSPLR